MLSSSAPHPLVNEVQELLTERGSTPPPVEAVLHAVLAHLGCVVGTVHVLTSDQGILHLSAQRGLPESLLPRIETIPVGKGMAGLAAERGEPVQVCNLQTDASGVAKPAARDSRMEGSIAVPMFDEEKLRGVLGVAKPEAYEFSKEEVVLLQDVANLLGKVLSPTKQG